MKEILYESLDLNKGYCKDAEGWCFFENTKCFFENGYLQSKNNEPALITTSSNGRESLSWYHKGKLHREDGSVKIYMNQLPYYYINGFGITEEEFIAYLIERKKHTLQKNLKEANYIKKVKI